MESSQPKEIPPREENHATASASISRFLFTEQCPKFLEEFGWYALFMFIYCVERRMLCSTGRMQLPGFLTTEPCGMSTLLPEGKIPCLSQQCSIKDVLNKHLLSSRVSNCMSAARPGLDFPLSSRTHSHKNVTYSQASQGSQACEGAIINANQLVIRKISARHKLQSQESGQIIPLSAAKLLRG